MQHHAIFLTQNEIVAVINVLGDLPTKAGAWPLLVKINDQLKAIIEEQKKPTSEVKKVEKEEKEEKENA